MVDEGTLISATGILFSLIVEKVVMIGLYRKMNQVEIKNDIEARGEVVGVSDIGLSINENLQVKLQLQFKRNEGVSCNVAVKTIVSRLNMALICPGCRVHIKYDPIRPEQIQLVKINFSEPGSEKGWVESLLDGLADLQAKGLITENNYRNRKGEVLREI